MKKIIVSLLILCANLYSASNNYYGQLFTKKTDHAPPSKIDPKKLDISIIRKYENQVSLFYLHEKQKIAQIRYRINQNEKHTVIIDEICVCQEYRGQGIGTHVLKKFLETARDHGYITCSLCAVPLDQNKLNKEYKKKLKKLIKWYKKSGFQIVKQNKISAKMQKSLNK